ncbi:MULTISPECIES: hypothetical protein [Dermacoccus]|uniref:Uncharacterized protein n=2 Tax=Dermacoccus TaxID=57495 RepID=A0A417Z0U9_9MICO|nr:hypothetical protein [Dermacoccus abyssi]RHW43996.1 hypothetical protein D1832_13625 [Dermacoccus abyssi]
MKATISWWDLADTGQTIDSLRRQLEHDGVTEWSKVSGLRVKIWISDPTTDRWGAVMLWDDYADQADTPPNRAAQLIGSPATMRFTADVELIVEGPGEKGLS